MPPGNLKDLTVFIGQLFSESLMQEREIILNNIAGTDDLNMRMRASTALERLEKTHKSLAVYMLRVTSPEYQFLDFDAATKKLEQEEKKMIDEMEKELS